MFEDRLEVMRLVFYGLVQGVGFRPSVYRTATALGLRGYIRNNGSNVEVVIDGDHEQFLERLRTELPPLAHVSRIELDDSPTEVKYSEFTIVMSEDGERSSAIPADTAICDDCLRELFDSTDRRFLYPFINCTNCGARFSAIAGVPYDRVNTSMQPFKLCRLCQTEYDVPTDRRFYAQTISCRDDGPYFTLYGNDGEMMDSRNVIGDFAQLIDGNAIGVLKSWGGMHLICNLGNLERFREWYGRPEKPFAVMARNLATAHEIAELTAFEESLLSTPQRPIVIVQKKAKRREDPLLEMVSPGLDNIGLYLPYSSIQHLLFNNLKSHAIIMTSANPPGEPIITDHKGVFGMGADIYLLHNRDIINRVDDSVIVPFAGRRLFIRKSRGFVPTAVNPMHDKVVVGVGAEENVTASLSTNRALYTTQHIGDVRDYKVFEFLRGATFHLMELFGVTEIDAVAADLHPLYTSKGFAAELKERYDVGMVEVQHHWAHAASLMVDNHIPEPVVCLTLDGAGYGTDGNIWGGEVLLSTLDNFERVAQIQYLPLIGGDRAVRDPRRLVFAIQELLGRQMQVFEDEPAAILRKAQKTSPLSSGFGRFLDAISCHLGACCEMTYDGEPAIKLERYLVRGKGSYEFDVEMKRGAIIEIQTLPLFEQLFGYTDGKDIEIGQKCDLAFSMVSSVLKALVECAADKAEAMDIENIGITGGCAYNIPIVQTVKDEVERHQLKLLVHNNVPCGDGGISVGQNAISGKKADNL